MHAQPSFFLSFSTSLFTGHRMAIRNAFEHMPSYKISRSHPPPSKLLPRYEPEKVKNNIRRKTMYKQQNVIASYGKRHKLTLLRKASCSLVLDAHIFRCLTEDSAKYSEACSGLFKLWNNELFLKTN